MLANWERNELGTFARRLLLKKGSVIAETLLQDLQETSTLISDPHVTPLGLRFPFLIIEAKTAATGGNLYQAQNQVAVSGSAALKIFEALSYPQDLQEEYKEFTENTTGLVQESGYIPCFVLQHSG